MIGRYLLAALRPTYPEQAFEELLDDVNREGTEDAKDRFRWDLLTMFTRESVLLRPGDEFDMVCEALQLDPEDDGYDGGTFFTFDEGAVSSALDWLGAKGIWNYQHFENCCILAKKERLIVWDSLNAKVEHPRAVRFLAACYGLLIDHQTDTLEVYFEKLTDNRKILFYSQVAR